MSSKDSGDTTAQATAITTTGEVAYGSIAWANHEIEASDRLLKEGGERRIRVGKWIFEQCQARQLSLPKAVEQLVGEGLNVNYKTVNRWMQDVPEYKQLQDEKKANPSPEAEKKRLQKEKKERESSHDEIFPYHVPPLEVLEGVVIEETATPLPDTAELVEEKLKQRINELEIENAELKHRLAVAEEKLKTPLTPTADKPRHNTLTPELVKQIKQLLAEGAGGADIGRRLNVTRQKVSDIKAGRIYKDIQLEESQ